MPAVGDVIVLAGDIHLGVRGVEWARNHFEKLPVIYTAGNHEYYGQVFDTLPADLSKAAVNSNVSFLDNEEAVINNIRFLGATLWTDFKLNGKAGQENAMPLAKHKINDFRGNIEKSNGAFLRPADVAEKHYLSVQWLENKLRESHQGPTIVVTHHPPCARSTHPIHRESELTPAFVSNLEELILEYQPEVWISGHTHYCCDYRLGETRVISNQRGYHDQDVEGFAPELVIEL